MLSGSSTKDGALATLYASFLAWLSRLGIHLKGTIVILTQDGTNLTVSYNARLYYPPLIRQDMKINKEMQDLSHAPV